MAVLTGGARWTEYDLPQFFPEYPSRVKASEVRVLVRARHGAEFHNSTWDRWLGILLAEHKLIRLPGARFARPRSEADLTHHVQPFTKRREVKPTTRLQELRHAVESTQPKKVKNNERPA